MNVVYCFTDENVVDILDNLDLFLSGGELEEAYALIKTAFEGQARCIAENVLEDFREVLRLRWEQERRRIA